MKYIPVSSLVCFFSSVLVARATGAEVSLPLHEPRLTEAQAREQLVGFGQTWHSRREWDERAKNIRAGILREAKLSPLPERCALNPIITGKQVRNGYSVENIYFQSLPGFFVTGNLYRPSSGNKKMPGMLCPHGHMPQGRLNEATQTRCVVLARMGVIVFAYDMIGFGDSTQLKHNDPNVLTLQLWDSIRSLDFLLSQAGVDRKRIGCTGESGGGTQTFLLGAVDDRVSLSVPVVMVSAHYFGGCKCETGLPIQHSAYHDTDNVEIAALFAPKPQCLISDGKDWTKNVPEVEFPYLQRVYDLYGARKQVENVHLANEGHDYGPSKRVGMYEFVAKHFKLDLSKVTSVAGKFDESDCTVDPASLAVFNVQHPRPESALKSSDEVDHALQLAKVAKQK